jgi:hypothetical protein
MSHGFDLVQGKIPMEQLLAEAQDKGFSPAGFQAFMQLEASDLASNNTYSSAQTRQYALSPGNQDTILRLRTQALREGWSPRSSKARCGSKSATAWMRISPTTS